jgi:hypothetical protein
LADAPFSAQTTTFGKGIVSPTLGQISVSSSGVLGLFDTHGLLITQTAPIGSMDACQAIGADVSSCTRVANPLTVADQGACCNACKNITACTNWIFGHPGDAEGNCWLIKDPQGIHSSTTRTLGGPGIGSVVSFSTNGNALYGRGCGPGDDTTLTAFANSAMVENRMTYVPYYFSTDGYSALGVVNVTTGSGKSNYFPADYSSAGNQLTWTFPQNGPFELYLMPAANIDAGTTAYYQLTGAARVPPRYAFGFIASRWGWTDRAYIEDVLSTFRSGQYPADAFITDFEWFTNVSDYSFGPTGYPWYNDFGYYNVTFPQPQIQLANYHKSPYNFKMGGIRKPRLGNTASISYAMSQGWILPGGELRTDGEFDETLVPKPEQVLDATRGRLSS